MLERLDYQAEGTTPDQVLAAFDNEMGVRTWRTPADAAPRVDTRPAGAPAWWESDEEASQSFLSAYAPGMA